MKKSEIKRKAEVALAKTNGLEPRVRMFIAYYLMTFNATESYRMAGYADAGGVSARSNSQRLLKHPDVQAALHKHLVEMHVPLVEYQARLAEISRGSFYSIVNVNDNGDLTLDWRKARDNGGLALVKKLKVTERYIPDGKDAPPIREVQTTVELHDPLAAIDQIAKIDGVYKAPADTTPRDGEGPLEAMTRVWEEGKRLDRKSDGKRPHK